MRLLRVCACACVRACVHLPMGVCFEDMWLLPGDSESIKPSSSGGVAPNYFEQGRSANTSAGKGTTPRAQETIEGAGGRGLVYLSPLFSSISIPNGQDFWGLGFRVLSLRYDDSPSFCSVSRGHGAK